MAAAAAAGSADALVLRSQSSSTTRRSQSHRQCHRYNSVLLCRGSKSYRDTTTLRSLPPLLDGSATADFVAAQNIGSIAVDWADIPLPNLVLSFIALFFLFYGADKVIPREDVVQMAAKQNAKKGVEMREQALRMAQMAEERGEETAAQRWRDRAEELSEIIATNEEASK